MEHYLYKRGIIFGLIMVAIAAFAFAGIWIAGMDYPETELDEPDVWEYRNGNCTIAIWQYNETATELIRYDAQGDCIGGHFSEAMRDYKKHIGFNETKEVI